MKNFLAVAMALCSALALAQSPNAKPHPGKPKISAQPAAAPSAGKPEPAPVSSVKPDAPKAEASASQQPQLAASDQYEMLLLQKDVQIAQLQKQMAEFMTQNQSLRLELLKAGIKEQHGWGKEVAIDFDRSGMPVVRQVPKPPPAPAPAETAIPAKSK